MRDSIDLSRIQRVVSECGVYEYVTRNAEHNCMCFMENA